MLTVHSSALVRALNCNGSIGVAGALSPVISGGSEGQAATWAAHSGLRGADLQTLIGTTAPNGVFVTSDMISHVAEFVSIVKGASNPMIGVDVSFSGPKFKVECVADHIALIGQTLHVDQFAYGWGIIEPENNYHLIAAAIGFCEMSGEKPETIVLTVHQPRPAHPLGNSRETVLEYKALQRHKAGIFDVLSAPGNVARSGMSWCRKCPALHTCPAAHGAAMNAIDYAAQMTDAPLDNDAIARELDELERAESAIKNRLEALERETNYRVKNGQIVGNYRVGPALGNRTWNNGLTSDVLLMLTGKDLRKEALISPAQAIAQGIPEDVVNALSNRPERGIRLYKADGNKMAAKLLKGKANGN